MPSNFSAFPYIQERSEATPGLWNYPLSVLSANIKAIDTTIDLGHFQQLSIGSTPPSYVTTAAVTIAVNSAYSDYLYLVDSSAQKSSYVIGSRAGNFADGLSLWDASAGTMIALFSKQSIRFFQNVVGPAFDTGGQIFNVVAYGARGNGITDDLSPIRAAVADAAFNGGGTIYFPSPSSWYVVSSTITLPEGVGLRGERQGVRGSQSVQNSIISRSGNFSIVSSYGTRGGSHQGGLRITDLQFSGGGYGQPLVDLRSQVFMQMRNVRLFDSGGSAGALLEEIWDSGFYNMYTDFCGSANTGAIQIYSGGSDNCNQMRFVDCDFESNAGCVIQSIGSGYGNLLNNELFFTRCKFESVLATSTHSNFMRLDHTGAVFIEDCTFTFNNTSLVTSLDAMIVATDCFDLKIAGFFETTGSVTTRNIGSFISLSACSSVEVAAFFAIGSNNTLSTNTAITCSTAVGQLDVHRSSFDPFGNTASASLVGGNFTTKRRHTAVDMDALSVGTVGMYMVPGSGVSQLGLGTSDVSCHLHIVSGGLSGISQGIRLQDITTNAATKVGRIKVSHFTNNEEPVTLVLASITSLNNIINVGGGSGAENSATNIRFLTGANTFTVAGTMRFEIDSTGGDLKGNRLLGLGSGSNTTPAVAISSNTSLGFYSSGAQTIAPSLGTLNLAINAVRFSMRTLAASSVTASAVNTNVARDEVVFSIGGASGASLIISSGGTAYIFASTSSAILA